MKHYFKLLIVFFCTISVVHMDEQENFMYETLPNQRNLSRFKRIVNGKNVENPNSYPFLTTLYILNSDNTLKLCGASLISPEWVLTAAHCIDNNPPYVEVILGDPNYKHTLQVFEAETFFIHEDWSNVTFQNDIGLIKLPSSVILNKNAGIIKIASDTSTFEGQDGTILGYGQTESGKESDALKQINVTIMSNEECGVIMYDPNKTITDSHICTDGTGEKGFCSGDSGGPLIVGNVLVGLASFTMPNCASGLSSVFLRVSKYSQWINKTIDSNRQNFDGKLLYFLLHIVFVVVTFLVISLLLLWYFWNCPSSENAKMIYKRKIKNLEYDARYQATNVQNCTITIVIKNFYRKITEAFLLHTIKIQEVDVPSSSILMTDEPIVID